MCNLEITPSSKGGRDIWQFVVYSFINIIIMKGKNLVVGIKIKNPPFDFLHLLVWVW